MFFSLDLSLSLLYGEFDWLDLSTQSDRCLLVLDGYGSLWLALARYGSLWVIMARSGSLGLIPRIRITGFKNKSKNRLSQPRNPSSQSISFHAVSA